MKIVGAGVFLNDKLAVVFVQPNPDTPAETVAMEWVSIHRSVGHILPTTKWAVKAVVGEVEEVGPT